MNLLFRLLVVLLRSMPRRGTVGVLDVTTLRLRVWPTDLDLNVHLNNGRYLSIMDLGRIDLILRVGLLGRMVRDGIRPVVGSVQIVYRRSLAPFQAFDLTTQLIGWDEKWTYLRQQFHDDSGAVCADAYVRALFVRRGEKLTSAEVSALAGNGLQSPDVTMVAAMFQPPPRS